MTCHCRRYTPKGSKPKGVGGNGAPAKPRTGSIPLNRGIAGRFGGITPPKVKPVKAAPVKARPAKVSARVAKYRAQEAKALAKANANPCKCTPGRP